MLCFGVRARYTVTIHTNSHSDSIPVHFVNFSWNPENIGDGRFSSLTYFAVC